jgi:hypothetical protein
MTDINNLSLFSPSPFYFILQAIFRVRYFGLHKVLGLPFGCLLIFFIKTRVLI